MRKEKFLHRALKAHGNKYTYDEVPETFNVRDKIPIGCPQHGVFFQTAYSHMNGHGCPKCKGAKTALRNRGKVDSWVSRGREKFGHFDYSEVPADTDGRQTVTVGCPLHGKFQTTMKQLMHSKHGCPVCAEEKVAAFSRMTYNEFLEKAREVHGDAYTYFEDDFADYENNQDKVRCLCRAHGVFTKSVKRLLGGEGCPRCSLENLWDKENPRRVRKKAGDVAARHPHLTFVGWSDAETLKVICAKHGEIQTTKHRLWGKFGCPKCTEEAIRKSPEDWLKDFKSHHGDKYDYSLIDEWPTSLGKIPIICHAHKVPFTFRQVLSTHASGHGCPRCKLVQSASGPSKAERELAQVLEGMGARVEVQQHVKAADSREFLMDIHLPEQNTYIEYNGVYWHSQKFIPSATYHRQKQQAAESLGSRLVHIFEDDWRQNREAVLHFLRYLTGSLPAVAARKTQVVPIEHGQAKDFYTRYHIQGYSIAPEQTHYALERVGEIIAVMSFTRHSSGRRVLSEGQWELVRFASKYRVQGGAGKLFKHFIRVQQPDSVLSFSWNHLFSGNMYAKLGFSVEAVLPPDYTYLDPNRSIRLHKSAFQRSRLKKRFGENFNPDLSEKQNCEINGFYRIYDCGKTRWVWYK